MIRRIRSLLKTVAIAVSLVSTTSVQAQQNAMPSATPGTVLPDRRPGEFKGTIGTTFADSKPDFPKNRAAPAGAPNIILILLDDVGFGATSTFGGPVPTPTLDRLAKGGLRYTQWNTTSLCSPTRAAFLTGHNHHEEGFGVVAEMSTGFPGYNAILPDTSVTIGEILKDNGYNTAWFGKNHNTPDSETSATGPFSQWPTGMGFEYFYGFNGGDTNQWSPAIIEGTKPVEKPGVKNYHFMSDMTDHAITWIRNQKSIAPNKPFLVYFAPGATHAPHHAPKEWADKFKGQFDQGWNKVSEETFNRMKQQGILPANSKYNPIPGEVGEWDQLSADQKKVYARMMEVYAGYLAYADEEVGRMLAAVDDLGISDNTLVVYAVGDNGASAEGGFSGTLNEIAADLNSYRPDAVPEALKNLDAIGGPTTYNHFPVGWALATNSPFKYAKREASHFGGTRNGLVIFWPKGIKDGGDIRTQFHYVSDIVPTVLEAAHIPQPKEVNGVRQRPMSGISMMYTFDQANANAPSRRHVQYFEMAGARAIYKDGWIAATTHGMKPWTDAESKGNFDKDTWELYNLANDFTEHDDLSAQNPQKLKEMQAAFMVEARKYNVLPLDDRAVERFSTKLTGRPAGALEGVNKITFYPGMVRLPEGSAPDMKNRSYKITAYVDTNGDANGILITQGGLFSGWALRVINGTPQFIYNWMKEEFTTIASNEKLPAGKVQIRFEFAYDGGGVGKGGTGTLYVNDKKVAEGHIKQTVRNRYSFDETMDVGEDTGTPVFMDYMEKMPFAFTGKLEKVTIELAPVPTNMQGAAEGAKREADEALNLTN
ncbi:arylsulfatase [Paraburkholderia fungorum]|uniref:Arylsulfatase n=1 Tax=Paraburkholderia fungorum TaxID=134537 RepID=A0A1H1JY05_9BURK|nr:arylsulfatase [Paraburkholderia fungorum]SDR54692.1 arylsulfatase [Paraburkholderia fungorum]